MVAALEEFSGSWYRLCDATRFSRYQFWRQRRYAQSCPITNAHSRRWQAARPHARQSVPVLLRPILHALRRRGEIYVEARLERYARGFDSHHQSAVGGELSARYASEGFYQPGIGQI